LLVSARGYTLLSRNILRAYPAPYWPDCSVRGRRPLLTRYLLRTDDTMHGDDDNIRTLCPGISFLNYPPFASLRRRIMRRGHGDVKTYQRRTSYLVWPFCLGLRQKQCGIALRYATYVRRTLATWNPHPLPFYGIFLRYDVVDC